MMKSITFLLAILITLTSVTADAAVKKKKKKYKKSVKKSTQIVSPYVISIGYPTTIVAYNALKTRTDVAIKDRKSVV